MVRRVPVIVYGVGGVGRALLRQIVAGRSVVVERNQIHFDIVGLADSQNWLWEPAGLRSEEIDNILSAKQKGQRWGQGRPSNLEILEQAGSSALSGVLVVDVTAQDGMEPVINEALARSYGVVLANKKPLAGPWETAAPYYNNPGLRHESTVGGGQPVIATLRYLMDTNDPPSRIEGQLSGTLGFICNRLDEGVPFSVAVAEAKSRGYTEPDPREDLGGLDVMRKVMILGRMAGWPLEATDIQVEALYPAELAGLSVPDFLKEVAVMDAPIKGRVTAARAEGKLLRFTAEVNPAGGSVGLKPIPQESPLAHLKYISFQTALYNDQPMMIGGRGAGVEMTAAGVLGDMIGLVREGVGG